MTTNYSGNPANVTTPLVRVVNGASAGAAGTVRISTTVAHLYATYDVVTISGVVGATQANGSWIINVISSTTFDLVGSTFSSAYVSGGTATDYSLTPYFQMPSNGEVGTVAGILASIQCLADRSQYLAGLGAQRVDVFNATGTWTCPPGCTSVDLDGFGGGGGGGCGGSGSTVAGSSVAGASAGGASIRQRRRVRVVPGTVYTVTVGAGGIAGTGSGSGGDGGDSSFGSLATFSGAGKGLYPGNALTTGAYMLGGSSVPVTLPSGAAGTQLISTDHDDQIISSRIPGTGGTGVNALANALTSYKGATSFEAYAGGVGGAKGAISGGTHVGGGGGGGGAAGPGGVGGAGGAGGAGNSAGAGVAGSVGIAPAANTGAGGGGGGSGGQGSSAGGGTGAGAAGGTGQLSVSYTGIQAVVA